MQDDIHDVFRHQRLQGNALWPKEGALNVSTSDPRYPHDSEVEARLSLFRRYYRLLADCRQALHSREAGTEIAT